MPTLTRRQSHDARDECWHIYHGDVHAGTTAGVRGLSVYCSDYKCAAKISADRWPDEVRLSDLEPLFVCQACGIRGADVRPDFDWDKAPEVGSPTSKG